MQAFHPLPHGTEHQLITDCNDFQENLQVHMHIICISYGSYDPTTLDSPFRLLQGLRRVGAALRRIRQGRDGDLRQGPRQARLGAGAHQGLGGLGPTVTYPWCQKGDFFNIKNGECLKCLKLKMQCFVGL